MPGPGRGQASRRRHDPNPGRPHPANWCGPPAWGRPPSAAIEADLSRPGFRGCPFNNASIEFDGLRHPARVEDRAYREQLLGTLSWLAVQPARGDGGPGAGGGAGDGGTLGAQLATRIDGVCTSAAHLGPDGPAAAGLGLARHLVQQARTRP